MPAVMAVDDFCRLDQLLSPRVGQKLFAIQLHSFRIYDRVNLR